MGAVGVGFKIDAGRSRGAFEALGAAGQATVPELSGSRGAALVARRRGKPSNHRIGEAEPTRVIGLIKARR